MINFWYFYFVQDKHFIFVRHHVTMNLNIWSQMLSENIINCYFFKSFI